MLSSAATAGMPSSPGILHLPQDVMKKEGWRLWNRSGIKNHALDCQVCEMLCQCTADSYWIQWPVITPTGGQIGLHRPTCIIKPIFCYDGTVSPWNVCYTLCHRSDGNFPEMELGVSAMRTRQLWLVLFVWFPAIFFQYKHGEGQGGNDQLELDSMYLGVILHLFFAKMEERSPPEWHRVPTKIKSFGCLTVLLYTCKHMCSLSADVEQSQTKR